MCDLPVVLQGRLNLTNAQGVTQCHLQAAMQAAPSAEATNQHNTGGGRCKAAGNGIAKSKGDIASELACAIILAVLGKERVGV